MISTFQPKILIYPLLTMTITVRWFRRILVQRVLVNSSLCDSWIVGLGPNSTWLVTSRHIWRVERVVTSVSSRACSNMADDEEAVSACVYKFSFFVLWICISLRNNFWQKWGGHVHPSPRCGDALNTCRASRACRDERVALCCPT